MPAPVTGLYADASSWSEVIPLLQKAGLHVTAVQNPPTSLADAGEDYGAMAARF